VITLASRLYLCSFYLCTSICCELLSGAALSVQLLSVQLHLQLLYLCSNRPARDQRGRHGGQVTAGSLAKMPLTNYPSCSGERTHDRAIVWTRDNDRLAPKYATFSTPSSLPRAGTRWSPSRSTYSTVNYKGRPRAHEHESVVRNGRWSPASTPPAPVA